MTCNSNQPSGCFEPLSGWILVILTGWILVRVAFHEFRDLPELRARLDRLEQLKPIEDSKLPR